MKVGKVGLWGGGGAGEEADTVGELGWEREAWSGVRKVEKRMV